ncbi:MAG: imidazoleglycerol-phosphate dehydratase [Candidatus Micrarchaeia archaeon]
MNEFTSERKTRESIVSAKVQTDAMRDFQINTQKAFLNHMIETLAWRSCMNLDVKIESKQWVLAHVIAEDSGIVLGRAFRQMFEEKSVEGIEGNAFAFAVIDEAKAFAAISMEGRTNCFVERVCPGANLEQVEDMLSCDLIAFLEGFSQGLNATIRVELQTGADPHHAWEAAFRALGEALRRAFSSNKWRKGLCVGVKGAMD